MKAIQITVYVDIGKINDDGDFEPSVSGTRKHRIIRGETVKGVAAEVKRSAGDIALDAFGIALDAAADAQAKKEPTP